MTQTLVDLLDTILPGDGAAWPAAGTHGLSERTTQMAAALPEGAAALETVLASLPGGFAALDPEQRETALRTLEEEAPDAVETVVMAAYNAYYTDPAVRDAIARQTGYENRPPQPEGFVLAPFDEGLLDAVKARGAVWRAVE